MYIYIRTHTHTHTHHREGWATESGLLLWLRSPETFKKQ